MSELRTEKRLLCLCLLMAWASGLVAGSPEAQAAEKKAYHLVLTGMINEASALWVKEGIEEALAGGADIVILEMDTPGGTVQASQDLGDYILKQDALEIVAYVNTEAISGGTMVALACDSIYMDERVGMIGDVAPVTPTGEMLPEKMQTVVRETLANYARQRGYPVALVQAMVSPGYTVYRLRMDDNNGESFRFERRADIEAWSEEEKDLIVSRELIVAEGELLTLATPEAVEYGMAAGGVSSRLHLFDELGLDAGMVERIYLTWTQRLLTLLNTLSPLFLIGGLILLYMELNEPGLGLPGILGVACLATFFLVKYSLHYAEVFEIILFAIGVGLLMLEIFVIPGFGLAGVSGIGLIFVSLVLMLQQFRLPSSPAEIEAFQFNLLEVTVVFLAVIFGLILLARFMGKVPFLKKVIRTETLSSANVYSGGVSAPALESANVEVTDMIGAEGIAITPLHPSGKAEFGDRQYDVTAEGEYIEKGARIEVVAARGRRLAVRRVLE